MTAAGRMDVLQQCICVGDGAKKSRLSVDIAVVAAGALLVSCRVACAPQHAGVVACSLHAYVPVRSAVCPWCGKTVLQAPFPVVVCVLADQCMLVWCLLLEHSVSIGSLLAHCRTQPSLFCTATYASPHGSANTAGSDTFAPPSHAVYTG